MNGFASAVMPGIAGGASQHLLEARVAVNQGQALDGEDAQEVVRQFEAMFVRQMLKSMRAATKSLGDGFLSGPNSDAYLEMFDGQIASRLTAGRGIGIGELLRAQLGLGADADAPRRAPASAPAAYPAAGLRSPAHRGTASAALLRDRAGTGPAMPAAAAVQARSRPLSGSAASMPARPFADAADFVRSLLPAARGTARRLGVSLRGLMAQMALETGWGRHVPPARDGRSSHNLFGIKAGSSWQGETTTLRTLELEDGVLQRRAARFRVYDSPAASLEDYAALLTGNPRYAPVLDAGASVESFAGALQAAGYATDPAYARKISSIANGELARLLDDLGVSE